MSKKIKAYSVRIGAAVGAATSLVAVEARSPQ